MRARKIAILLAITALSALTMFFVLLADADALGAEFNRPEIFIAVPWQGPDSKADVEDWAGMSNDSCGDLRLSTPAQAAFAPTTLSGSLPSVWHGSATTLQKGR